MRHFFRLTLILLIAVLVFTTPANAASSTTTTPTPEMGMIKLCKVAGTGVPVGQPFTIRAGNQSYSVPAGPGDGGYCVLAGQYPADTQVLIEELIPPGYYVSRIEVKPDRAVDKNVSQGAVTVRVGSGVTEIIFTNKALGSPTPTRTPTPLLTSTPRPTRTPTSTPSCAPDCTPTPTPIPRGRLQICKEAAGADVSGYFTFRFSGRSVTIPVGACSGLMRADVGSLTITEDARSGYSVTDIYTIPADRLTSKDPGSRSATVSIVEGNASTQTIVIFRNRATTPSVTFTPSRTPTSTPTRTPLVCQPVVVTPDFSQVAVGSSVEGLGAVDPRLNIDARGTAVHIREAMDPAVYGATVNGANVINAGMLASGGFSDPSTMMASQPHEYTFTFAPGVAVSNFSLHMLDYGDLNPTGNTSHVAMMTAYNANGSVVSSQELSYTTVGSVSSVYGDLLISGDAIAAAPGQPGNWTWNVAGSGIVSVVLEFGAGYDPNIGFDLLSFTTQDCGPLP